jgi:hypothetical protein
MKTVENELQDKVKVDRGLLNSWFVEVQRTKVTKKTTNSYSLKMRFFLFKEEAEKYRKRRGSTVDHDKQLRLALQEIEQVKKKQKQKLLK